MRRSAALIITACLSIIVAACAPAGVTSSDQASASGLPAVGGPGPASPGSSTPASAPAFTTGPTGTPIGQWSVTLTGGPEPGTYGGTDEMVCTTLAGGPTSVGSNPVSSPPIGHIDMVTGSGPDDKIYVSAGGLEGGGNYQNDPDPAVTVDGPTVTNGILHLKMSGTQNFPGDPRTIVLEATCPLFPAETDG